MKVRNNDRTPSSMSSSKELSSKSIDAVTNKSIQDNLCVFGFFYYWMLKYYIIYLIHFVADVM